MAQQAKRAPGRPRTTQAKKTEPQAKQEVKKSFKRKVEAPNHKVYQLVSGGGVVYMLQTKGISMYDEETDMMRELRYCPSENSVWSDEQRDDAVRKPILFRDGTLLVKKTEPNLMEYLDRHPQNVENGGNVFKVLDKSVDAKKELDTEFLLVEAISMVRDKDINDLLPVAVYFGIGVGGTSSEIRHNLLRTAKKNPKKFIQAFDDPAVKVKSLIHQANEYNIIKLSDSGAYWFDSNTIIVANPAGANCSDTLARFCMTEKGAAVLSTLEDHIDKL
ncbi:MAG: hypothetical protein Unbinned4409contig1001_32 [Prokaryotic dsDNA virus sp.]|nr:MAG: hypothetical protein Unbinned4409contig1001_32 [Prokaryotic dsDNA virus sp.]|tara:strand:- start:3062 stop:3886 length:825 start_codon:yes stop_codon:yes gene_type:complete